MIRKLALFVIRKETHSIPPEFLYLFLGIRWQEDCCGLRQAQNLLSQYFHPFGKIENKHADQSHTVIKPTGFCGREKTKKDRAGLTVQIQGYWFLFIKPKCSGPSALTDGFYTKLQLILGSHNFSLHFRNCFILFVLLSSY